MFCQFVRAQAVLWILYLEYSTVKYVPQWFPGAGFQRQAAYDRTLTAALVNRPWKFVKDAWVRYSCLFLLRDTYLAPVERNRSALRRN